MRIDWWTLALQTVNALVLIWILGRFLFRPVADGLAARRAEAVKLLADAETAKAAAEAARAEAEAEVARRRGDHDATVAAARAEAETAKQAMLADAAREVERRLAEASAEIDRRRALERDRTETEASRLAVAIAARLTARLPAEALIAGFVPGFVAAVATLPEATRAELAVEGVVRPRVPRALSGGERDALAAALAPVVGGSVAIAETVDPAVIAGLEITTAHAVIRNSLAADLERIEAELTHHDRS